MSFGTNFSGMYDGTGSLSDLVTEAPVIQVNPSAVAAIQAVNSIDITQAIDYDALAKLCAEISKGVTFA